VSSLSSHYGSGRDFAIRDHRAIKNNNHRQVTWVLQAKRRKRDSQDDSDDVFSNWYERVDKSATPDNVFWNEMARQQRAIAAEQQQSSSKSVSEEGTISSNPIITNGSYSPSSTSSAGGGRNPSSAATQNPEAVLQSFAYAARSNNFLADMIGGTANEYTWDYSTDDEDEEEENADDILKTINEQEEAEMELQRQRLDEELDYLLSLPVEEMQGDRDDSDEIWDIWANRDQEQYVDTTISSRLDDKMNELERLKHERSLSKITIKCKRLEKAQNNPIAASFFARPVDEMEGYEQMWVAAIEDNFMQNLVGQFRSFGVQFADNFDTWEDQSPADAYRSIEDIAAYKARKVYEITGLPCIASRTSFEVEPVKNVKSSGTLGRFGPSPKVASGYKFNNIGKHVDQIVEALQPTSDPCRLTHFRSVLCYYDGETEIFDYGECYVDIGLCSSIRSHIPMAVAINEMSQSLQLAFNLRHHGLLRRKVKESIKNMSSGRASMKLRDRVLKDAKVLPNGIIDVSAFMDSMVDVSLMDECADEMAKRFIQEKPSKILTAATTGLVFAIPMAKYLQVPVVYARKERSVVMSSTYQAAFTSKTVGKNRELIVSKSHLHSDDRILVVDDFLSSGSSQVALLRIIADSGATAVGVAALLEKMYDSGRQFLSGYNVPVESMVRVASVKGGVLQLMEEEGFEDE